MPGLLASDLGRILLPARTITMPKGGTRTYEPKPTFGSVTTSSKKAAHKFMNVANRHFGNIKVHRAVCEAFHGPKPFEGAVVIHIDEDGTNNRADNLKWGTQKENLNMPKFLEYCRNRTGENSPVIKGRHAIRTQ